MKNTREISFDIVRGGSEGRSTAVNMRRRHGALEAVGEPAEVAVTGDGERLLGTDRRGVRTYFFVQTEDHRVVIAGYSVDGEFTVMGETLLAASGAVTAMAACGEFVLLAAPEGLLYVRYDGERYEDMGGRLEVPELQFGTVGGGTLGSEIAETTLKSTYTNWQGTLSRADSQTLKTAMTAAIDDIQGQAGAAGLCLEPILLRTAVRLWDDTLLWSDCPTLTGELWKPEALSEVSDGGERRVSGVRLTAESRMPTVRVVKADFGKWAPLVKAVEIYASTDVAGYPSFRFRAETKQGSSDCYLRMTAVNLNETALLQEKIGERRLRRIAVITDIVSLANGRLAATNLTAVADGIYAIRIGSDGAMAEPQKGASPSRPAMLAPVGTDVFAAQTRTSLSEAPSLTALADLSTRREAVTTAVCSVETTTTAGTGRRVRSELTDGYSLKLNKLVTYPDSRARELTAIVVADGARYRCDIALQPSADGGFAYAVSADGFELKADDGTTLPEAADIVAADETTLMQCRGGNPLVWERCEAADNPGITAVMPTFRYGSSWTLGRAPVCLFATDGVRLLTFSTAGRCTASTRISKRTVSDRRLVAATDDGLAFVDTLGEVCRFRNSKITGTDIIVADATAVAYSTAHEEVLVSTESGIVTVAADNGVFYRPERFSEPDGAYAVTGAGTIVDFDRETPREIEVEVRTVQYAARERLKAVVWDIDASGACALRLEVTGENGHSCHGAAVSALTLRGVPTVPVRHRVASPRMRTFRLAVSGRMPSGTRLEGAIAEFG